MSRKVDKNFNNAVESYAIYDSVQIRGSLGSDAVAGYSSYAALAARSKIPFFNVRNQGEVGLAYNNLDTKDQMAFAFHCYSIGLSFSAPVQCVTPAGALGGSHNPTASAQFVQAMPYHTGLRFKVQQDEKLLHTAHFAPEGAGPYGVALGTDFTGGVVGTAGTASITSQTSGQPLLTNRWPFPKPISIPRGATYSVELEFSEFGKELLGALPGPANMIFGSEGDLKTVQGCALIRCSLFGAREVQQRNELHY